MLEIVVPGHLSQYWKSKFNIFGNVSMKTLGAKLDVWEVHWSQSKIFPDSVNTTLNSINFSCFPIIKTGLRIIATLSVTSCSCEI